MVSIILYKCSFKPIMKRTAIFLFILLTAVITLSIAYVEAENETCSNECSSGETGCADSDTKWTCELGADSCYYQISENCADGEECSDGDCVESASCTDECTLGDEGCTDIDTWWACELQPDGCYDKIDFNCALGEICDNGACIVNDTVTCTDDCMPGEGVCYGGADYWNCELGDDGCWDRVDHSCDLGYVCNDYGECVINDTTTQATCTDSDGGADYYTKGTVSGVYSDGYPFSETDYCDGRYIHEWECNTYNQPYQNYKQCGTAAGSCQDGACITPPTCTDTDGGDNTATAGTCTGANGVFTEEGCYSDTGYIEYYCGTTGNCEQMAVDCPGLCESATCVDAPLTCTDSDGGFDLYVLGTTTDNFWSYTDSCMNSQDLIEYICHTNNTAILQIASCSPDICLDGVCTIAPTAECYDSDGGTNYYTLGTVINDTGNYTDYCFSTSQLIEYRCIEPYSGLYTCPSGCENGICVNETTTCTDECVVNSIGCNNTAQKWTCTLQADGCYDQVYSFCDINYECLDGLCVYTAPPNVTYPDIIELKNDDDERDSGEGLFNSDDRFKKFLEIEPEYISYYDHAQVVIFGKQRCDKGTDRKQYLYVNLNDPVRYEPCDLFGTEYSWVALDIDYTQLVSGRNELDFRDLGNWQKSSLTFGVDLDSGNADSYIKRDRVTRDGELMVRLYLCKGSCSGTPEEPPQPPQNETPPTGNRTSRILFSDDGLRNQAFSLYNSDDEGIKYIPVETLDGIVDARLWIYGKTKFCGKGDGGLQYYQINNQPAHGYDACNIGLTPIWGWTSIDIPVSELQDGSNSITFTDEDYWKLWKSDNLQIAIDTDSDGLNSYISQDDRIKSGELLIRLEICDAECPDRVVPDPPLLLYQGLFGMNQVETAGMVVLFSFAATGLMIFTNKKGYTLNLRQLSKRRRRR